MPLLYVLEYVPVYVLAPRFVISMRELYACDGQGLRVGGPDTGFGLSLSSLGNVGTAMVFADVGQNEVEEIPMEVRTA